MKMTPGQAAMLRERNLIVAITSAAVRLIGICVRDGRLDLIDEAQIAVNEATLGLVKFGAIAGSDTGVEYTIIALQQITIWMKQRDVGSAKKAFEERCTGSDAEFIASIERALEEVNRTKGWV